VHSTSQETNDDTHVLLNPTLNHLYDPTVQLAFSPSSTSGQNTHKANQHTSFQYADPKHVESSRIIKNEPNPPIC
jgi:hypothetical protein